jgi:hypothetical protein
VKHQPKEELAFRFGNGRPNLGGWKLWMGDIKMSRISRCWGISSIRFPFPWNFVFALMNFVKNKVRNNMCTRY